MSDALGEGVRLEARLGSFETLLRRAQQLLRRSGNDAS